MRGTPQGRSARLVRALARRLHARLVETATSWVLLAGGYAWKVKKPLRLPFLDYSSFGARQRLCREEFRVNHRIAPRLYLGVVRITGTLQEPSLGGPGRTLDHAVWMRRFPADGLMSARVDAGTCDAGLVRRLAQRIVVFQSGCARVPALDGSTEGQAHLRRALAALDGVRPVIGSGPASRLEDWFRSEAQALAPLWEARAAAGLVRDGHGDLHLGNIALFEGAIVPFDAIEFDRGLRRNDVFDETAFVFMDLLARGTTTLAWTFLDAWLEATGDFEGLPMLRFAVAYRALVRARAEQARGDAAQARRYLAVAAAQPDPPPAALYIMHGLPGSGKTYQSATLLAARGAVRVRSDVERKRLAGLQPLADSRAAGHDIYTAQAAAATYQRLFDIAASALQARFIVVLDAAFLLRSERAQARALAAAARVPLHIVACDAPLEELQRRVRARARDASEADLAVLERLRHQAQPLGVDELPAMRGPVPASSWT
ncbi:MAG: AAA family ATPase [Burkholderiales bacterium]|nr:AAA family ATPase [Burkholderiales bacterium]